MSILVTLLAVVLVFWYSLLMMNGGLGAYIDLPSLILVLLFTIPVLISAGMLKDFTASFRRAFSRKETCTREGLQRSMEAVRLAESANWIAGIVGFLIAVVCVCRQWDGAQPDGARVLLANMSVAVISIIYAAVLNLVLLAVYGRLKKRFMDYMKGE